MTENHESEHSTEATDEASKKKDESEKQHDNAEITNATSSSQARTWYPYITKVQFEKFLSRLENKTPDVIDRDYVRAIIRTPSMIHRFLRGIEAMQLIDRDQKPTALLRSLIDQNTRRHTLADILRGLYSGILEQWHQSEGKMDDREITLFFRNTTSMGNDSANKMKMFFKYLVTEADFSPPPKKAPPTPKNQSPAEATTPDVQTAPAVAQEEPPTRGRQRDQNRSSDTGSNRPDKPSSRKSVQEKQDSVSIQQTPQASSSSERPNYNGRPLSETQKAYLAMLQDVLEIKIDGDWDDDMIRLTFDRLERLFDRVKRG